MKPAIVLVAMLWLGADALAQDYVNDEFHFAISFPPGEGWARPEIKTAAGGGLAVPQRLLLVARKSTGDRVSVQILDVGDKVSVEDPDYREGFRDGNVKVFPSSVGLISENVTTFGGVPSYELLMGGTIQALPINIRMVAVVANRLQYNVTGYASDRSRLTRGDVGRVLASFRFTEPPMVPVAPPGHERSTGELAGRLTAYLVAGIIMTLLIRQMVKRRKVS
jgi:hypothetical protein